MGAMIGGHESFEIEGKGFTIQIGFFKAHLQITKLNVLIGLCNTDLPMGKDKAINGKSIRGSRWLVVQWLIGLGLGAIILILDIHFQTIDVDFTKDQFSA